MNGPFGRTARFWRRIHLGRNPLARRSDRVEAVVLLVAVLGLLIALPLAALVGTNTYRGQLAVSAQQQASRHLTTATLVENAPTPVPATDGAYLSANGGTTGTHARWTLPDGAERVGTVAADPGSPAGTRVPVWLSDAGNPVPAPMTSSDATTTGILAGIFAWLVVALGLTAVYWSVRLVLDRRRAVHWEREWQYAGERWARF
ncbi:Rv1733c family protein [Amycolatopsis sacchari]|uniref:Membrane protein n=1 Tax=Amycolatopsis dongchuanensis TaxID=1070866 RepID=A0ABP9QE99_9PSEU